MDWHLSTLPSASLSRHSPNLRSFVANKILVFCPVLWCYWSFFPFGFGICLFKLSIETSQRKTLPTHCETIRQNTNCSVGMDWWFSLKTRGEMTKRRSTNNFQTWKPICFNRLDLDTTDFDTSSEQSFQAWMRLKHCANLCPMRAFHWQHTWMLLSLMNQWSGTNHRVSQRNVTFPLGRPLKNLASLGRDQFMKPTNLASTLLKCLTRAGILSESITTINTGKSRWFWHSCVSLSSTLGPTTKWHWRGMDPMAFGSCIWAHQFLTRNIRQVIFFHLWKDHHICLGYLRDMQLLLINQKFLLGWIWRNPTEDALKRSWFTRDLLEKMINHLLNVIVLFNLASSNRQKSALKHFYFTGTASIHQAHESCFNLIYLPDSRWMFCRRASPLSAQWSLTVFSRTCALLWSTLGHTLKIAPAKSGTHSVWQLQLSSSNPHLKYSTNNILSFLKRSPHLLETSRRCDLHNIYSLNPNFLLS